MSSIPHNPSAQSSAPGTTAPASSPQPNTSPALVPLPAQDTPEAHGKNAFNSERPLGVAPVPEGGVAIGGQPNLPEGHAHMGDKIIGKAQKVIGKYSRDPELHEKGELRETGGKAAAEGRARAAHD